MRTYETTQFQQPSIKWICLMLLFTALMTFTSCEEDEMPMKNAEPTGMSSQLELGSVSDPNINGTVTFEELESGETKITIMLNGTSSGNEHPAHIHNNTAAEGGDIAVSLTPVDGETGMSETIVSEKDDGTSVTYSALLDYDGYINVHNSADDLATLIAQGDVGENALTGESMSYDLMSKTDASISGKAEFWERMNGETLVKLSLMGTSDGGDHPAHIHMNTAAEGGSIAISLNNVMGASGMSWTNVAAMDDDTPITYEELIAFDGYINVHNSADDLATLIAQGDVGQNALTGESMSYDLMSKSDASISGKAEFWERMNGETLVKLSLMGTSDGGDHPAHIHMNTAAEGGSIAISLNNVMGASGMSWTNVVAMDDDTPITYDELIAFDGYINVHKSADDLATLIAQGDVGQNALTGEFESYELKEKDVSGISGTAEFHERVNGETLISVELSGAVTGDHPMHIHAGSVAEAPGAILITLNSVNAEGMSLTNVTANDMDEEKTYEDLINVDGYINVHMSADDLGTLIAQGNVGANAAK